jgi:hypothetical protein
MITELMNFFNVNQPVINFVSHTLIFIGTFYVALHNRNLPQWHITPLWYTGLFSLLTSFTILFQWAIGPEFPLSYWNFGQLAESLVDISLASIATIMLIGTIRKDIAGAKKRRNKQD